MNRNPIWLALAALAIVSFSPIHVLAQDAETPAPDAEAPVPDAEEPAPEGAAPGVSVARIAVCTDVQDREPIGEAESFASDVGYLFCFTAVECTNPPVQVFHRWFMGDELVAEIPVSAKGTSWRCWSRKTIPGTWSGSGRVEVLTEAGDRLESASFSIEPRP